ncbi:FMN-dependent dehydrogenase [Diaporthe helianthi]|uniref:FMN-dependent dehydrogenase n=1 Tax=Diaporthe helianthi TaxID=158607 RepID=A0A2P5I2A1_DIAHE|nr:FMN-dependent dehydrogenase [Diaporthe helianthi]
MTSGKELDPITISDVREIAKKHLAPQAWDYYRTGADDEHTLRRNEEAFQQLIIRPRVLRDVSIIDTGTTILGKRYDIPIAVAPSAYQKLAGGNGEVDVARASFALGTNMILSSNATTTLEDVAEAVPRRAPEYPAPWFQLYFIQSRELTAGLVQRAEKAGYEALVLTVDTPILGNRLHERRKPLELPPGMAMANAQSRKAGAISKAGLILRAKTAADYKRLMDEHSGTLVDNSLGWTEVIPWLRSQTKMKLLLKGIMTSEDAELALEAGVDGIIVSNHGGRQLDGVSSTIEALPEIVDVIRGRIPVIVDGGITHGSDVFKALALGADLCLIGRTALWGLSWNGQKGVEDVLHILERELARTMALAGAASLKDIAKSMLGRAKTEGFGIAKL